MPQDDCGSLVNEWLKMGSSLTILDIFKIVWVTWKQVTIHCIGEEENISQLNSFIVLFTFVANLEYQYP